MADLGERLDDLERRLAALERPIPAGEMSKMESAIETRVSSSVHLKLANLVNSANWLAGRVHAIEGRLDPSLADQVKASLMIFDRSEPVSMYDESINAHVLIPDAPPSADTGTYFDDLRCAKCGAGSPAMKYHAMSVTREGREAIGCTCRRCGYDWSEIPLDASENS